MLKIYFGHHKCASTWLTLIIERVCNEMGLKISYAFQDNINRHGGIQQLIDNEKPDFLIVPESGIEKLGLITSEFKAFHIIRDPRDIIVSSYFSHRNTHQVSKYLPTKEHQEMLQKLSQEDGIAYEITKSKAILHNINKWDYNYDNVYETRFEIITTNTISEFNNVFSFLDLVEDRNKLFFDLTCYYNRVMTKLGLPCLRNKLKFYQFNKIKKLLMEFAFIKLANGRPRGDEDKYSHYRKGISGDWKKYLTDEHLKSIHAIFPELINKLTYAEEEHISHIE